MVLLSISFILSCLACFNGGGKEEADLFQANKIVREKRWTTGARDFLRQYSSINPTKCLPKIRFIHSLHFSVRV